MHDLLTQVFGYLRGIWRYRWLAVAASWAVAIAGWMYIATIPDEYRSSARVFVDTNSMLRPLLQGLTIQPDHVQRVALMSRMLLNRPNLEKIVRMSDLDMGVRTAGEREALLSDIQKRISIGGDRRNPSLYTVAFEHTQPETAKRVVQSLVSIFIEEALTSDQRATASAQNFIDQEIADYETRLKESEQRLADFKREHAGLLPGEGGGYYGALEKAKADLENAELALQEALNRRKQLAEQLEEQDDALGSGPEDLMPETFEDPRISNLRAKLDELLLRYTDRHPDVIELRRVIAEIRERNKNAGPGLQSAFAAVSVPSDTIYGSLRMAVSEADALVASMEARVADYAVRVKEIEEKIDSIPDIEAEMKQLTRNYSTLAQQHGALLQRRESARLSEQVEKTTEGVKFRVIDPPVVPLKPSAPNRAALAGLVLVLAVGAGVAVALAMDLVRPVFDDRRLLYQATGLPVFGTVALVQSYSERRKERLMLIPFIVLSGGLVVVFTLVVVGLPSFSGVFQ